MEVVINYWAVLVAAVAAVVLGAMWYGPLFGKQWMRLAGIQMPGEMTKSMEQAMIRSYVIQLISVLIMAFVLAHVLYFASAITDLEGVIAAITSAIWVWLGFVVPVTLGPVLWETRPWKYWFITSGYYLVALCVMSAILTAWQ
ncbi:MAG TPA: DUF1761 domain-containing protein [Candidatus Paceibacterota bacterium]|nr:DUF1761 domain-containing protein [Candidatus Paceibacterota bacterium]